MIFGWPNLQKIFIEENIFCSDVTPAQNETSLDITATVSSSENVSTTISPTTLEVVTLGLVPKISIFCQLKILTQNECKNLWEPFKDNCSSQETDLTTAYTYACVVFALVGVPVGAIFDKFGTMATRLIGASLFLFGNILVLSSQNNHR